MHVGGHVEEEEFFDEALRREIKEEVNLNVSILNMDKKSFNLEGSVPLQNPFFIHGKEKEGKRKLMIDYICEAKEPIDVKLQPEEIEAFKWVTKDELETIDTPILLKELAKKAFVVYTKIKDQK